MSQAIYKQKIIDRFQRPLHMGHLENPSAEAEISNALCGDRLKFEIEIKNNHIQNLKWTGEGCAICLASADLLADKFMQIEVDLAKKMSNADMFNLLGIELKPSRQKCALLSLECVKQALN